ncbi:MAG: alternate F1F0 ATPase, F1 subunit alpha [Spirochaeta sp.]
MSGNKTDQQELSRMLDSVLTAFDEPVQKPPRQISSHEVGIIQQVGRGIATITGLKDVQAEELLRMPGGGAGLAFTLSEHEVGVVLFESGELLSAGQEVRRTGRVMDVPVGDGLLGRVVDPLARPLDGKGRIHTSDRAPMERDAPAIMDRLPVATPLKTGIQVIDALIPIGRGQRELIVGDRQIGKTAIVVDTMINQKDDDVVCVYCAIGKRNADVRSVMDSLEAYGVMDRVTVVSATGDDPPGLNYLAPYAATAMAEYYMHQGRNALIIYDDLTRHARAYRELSLLLRRPPAREAYPGDIFYVHSRLLERATHLREELGGGSLTALPIVETQAQNISAYIPTNLISITDGQIYLSPDLHQQGVLPAVDIGKSVSRVGGKAQLPAYQDIAGDLKLAYSQFEELESFARFGTRLDKETRKTLNRGRHVREVLKQEQFQTVPAPQQIAVLLAVNEGIFDSIPMDMVHDAKTRIQEASRDQLGEINERIMAGEELSDEDKQTIADTAREATRGFREDEEYPHENEEG